MSRLSKLYSSPFFRSPSFPYVLYITLAVGSIFVVSVIIGIRSHSIYPETVTDVARYEEILNSFPILGLTDHFPKAIPANAKNERLNYFPGFMQGSGNFELRVTLPPKEIEQIVAKYDKMATHRFTGGDNVNHINQPNTVPIPSLYTGDAQDHKFPDSFEILVLGAESMGSKELPWNKGESYGLAVDRSSSEVVYWAAWW